MSESPFSIWYEQETGVPLDRAQRAGVYDLTLMEKAFNHGKAATNETILLRIEPYHSDTEVPAYRLALIVLHQKFHVNNSNDDLATVQWYGQMMVKALRKTGCAYQVEGFPEP